MNSKITEEEERLIVENMRLVPHIVKQMGINRSNYNYEDLIQIGYIGLVKAARTFDCNKAKFTSYACICIRNEVLMFLRKENQIPTYISLEEECTLDKYNCYGLTYGEIIEDKDSEFIEDCINQESLKKVLSLILNCFTVKEKLIMLYDISGLSQQDISKKVNLTQSSISRAQKRIRTSLRELINTAPIYERKYEVEVLDGKLIIKVNICNIKAFNLLLEKLECEAKSANTHDVFSLECVKNELIMKFTIDFDSCYVIARVIQFVENYD